MKPKAIRSILALAFVLGLVLAVTPAALAADTWTVNAAFVDDTGCVSPTFQCKTIEAAVGAASAGDTINVLAGTYTLSTSGQVNLDKANLTLSGAGSASTHVQVSGTGYSFYITASGVTMQGFDIAKTDKTDQQQIIYIGASNTTIKDNLFHGQYVLGDPEVSRAMITTGGLSGLLIENNTIHSLRQPGYISGVTTGDIKNNTAYGTRGWVLEQGDMTFTNNHWGTGNVYDIVILPGVNAIYYTDIVAMSNANNGAVVEDQRPATDVLSVVYVDDSAAPGGNGGQLAPYQAITLAVARVVAGGTIKVAAGTYLEDVTLDKALTLSGAGIDQSTIMGLKTGSNGATVRVTATAAVLVEGFTITRDGNNTTDWATNVKVAGLAIQLAVGPVEVRNNKFAGNRTAIDINDSSGHTIRNNVITDNRTGLVLRNQTDNLTVVENEITNNWTLGFVFLDASSGSNVPVQTALNCTFANNNISGNWYGQILDRQTGGALPAPGANPKNFSGDWLGTTAPVVSTANSTEPGYSAQIPVAYGGTAVPPAIPEPDILGAASANIDFTPYLNAGTDTDVETTPGRGTNGFQGDFSNLWVTAAGAQTGATGRVQEGIDSVSGSTVNVAPGTYTENVNVNKPLNLRGSAGGDFSAPVAIAQAAAPGVWYVDRYAPGVFESYSFGGEMVLRHGIRAADVQGNSFYNYQGRKLDTNLTGTTQSMTIDLWVDASWSGASRNAGIWSTGFDAVPGVSAYPIMAWRSGGADPAGFYAFDYINGGWLPLKVATAGDYGRWHTLTFVFTIGTGVEYFVDGASELTFADAATQNLGNLILNAYNFAADYEVYWDNFKVGSAGPATYESVVIGQMTISASDVEVTGLYLKNPGQAYGVLASGALNNITIANNRIQDVGGAGSTAQIKGVYLPNGPDNVTISNNVFSNIVASSTKSADAINFGDSNSANASTGVVIQANSFSNIAAGRGAYGILLNNGAGTPGAQITDNTFSGLNGAWTHAIGLEGPTPNAVVSGNSFSDLTATGADKSAVFFEDNPDGGTVAITHNSFLGTGYLGTTIHPKHLPGGGGTQYAYLLDAESNYWGDLDTSGPGPVGPGTGVNVGPQVDYQPWCNADFSNCTYGLATTISMQVSSSPAEVGEVVTMDTLVTADNVFGMQLNVQFDATKLEFQAPPESSHNNVAAAGWYWDYPGENFAAVTGGRRLSGTMQDPPHASPAMLTGQSVATWKFKCLQAGTWALTYDATAGTGTYLATRDGSNIPATLTNATVECLATTASVDGWIKLQGRQPTNPIPAAWQGTDVMLTCVPTSGCDGFGPYTMTTDASGQYQHLKTATPGSGVVLGTYTATAARRAYLGAAKTTNVVVVSGSNTVNTLATAPRLLGGNVVSPAGIDIFDLSAIGGAFGASVTPDTGNDVNGDGFVNIFDLVLAGGNFDKTFPQPW